VRSISTIASLRRAARLAALLGCLTCAVRGSPSSPVLAETSAKDAARALEPALAALSKDNFAETARGIDALAASGSPRAASLLEALRERRLLVERPSGRLLLRDGAGVIFDARTAERLEPPPADARPVRINNRLRSAVDAALGTLRLYSPDRNVRAAAAEAIFRARDRESLVALRGSLAKEGDVAVRRRMAEAEAAIVLGLADAPIEQRLAALTTLEARADRDAIAAIRAGTNGTSGPVRVAADEAVRSIEQRLALLGGLQNVWYGLSLGSVLLLAALGLAITFGVMGVINMAHGEMVMLGAYTTYVVQEVFRALAPGALDWSIPIAIPLAFLVAGAVGIAIERGVIQFLYGRPLETLLATWGVSLVLQQAVRSAFGPTNKEVSTPSYMTGGVDIGGLTIAYGRLWIIVATLAVFVALLVVLKATPIGLQMRAVTQNRQMAASMGIRTGRVDAITFGLGSGIAGIAGVALAQIDNVSPNLGQSYIIDCFMVVVFGGVGNLWGTLVSAFSLGIANKLLEPFAGAVLAKIGILVLLVLFIQKRPRGLFALKGRAVEA
jgi:urea transport system permease protein